MSKVRVPIFNTPGKSITVDPDATMGAVVGVNLFLQNGTVVTREMLLPQALPEPELDFTYWRLVREVPANVVALAQAIGTGLFAVTGSGAGAFRELLPTAGRTTVSNGDGVAGNPVVDLAVVPDAGGGTFKLIVRDAYGRTTGTSDGDTDDVPEGVVNLYHTSARVDARITLQKGQPNGLAPLDAGGKLDGAFLPDLAITDTFVVASQAAMLALPAQRGDVAVRTDISQSLILVASPATTLGNWQALLTPTSPVTSVFGRVGAVVAQTGDYTAAQVGAEPTVAAGTTAQFWRGDKTWVDFATTVRATVLTGLSLASAAAITAADTLLSALGKLQAQINANVAAIAAKLDSSLVSAFALTVLDDANAAAARVTLEAMPDRLVVAGTNADYSYVAADANVARGKTTSTARIYTVDCSLLTVGAFYYAANYASAGNVSVAAAVGTTLRLAGSATTGTRTVPPFSIAKIWIRSATEAWVEGTGVT